MAECGALNGPSGQAQAACIRGVDSDLWSAKVFRIALDNWFQEELQ